MVTAVLSEDSLSPPALVPSSRVVFVVVSSKFIGIARGGFGAVRPEARPPRGRRRAEDATGHERGEEESEREGNEPRIARVVVVVVVVVSGKGKDNDKEREKE